MVNFLLGKRQPQQTIKNVEDDDDILFVDTVFHNTFRSYTVGQDNCIVHWKRKCTSID